VFIANGELGLVSSRRANGAVYGPEDRARWHSMFISIAQQRNYKPGWVAHKYKEKFNTFPTWGSSPQPIPPTPEVESWVRSRNIAFAKRRTAA
jgi:DNA repair protein RadD